MRESSKPHTHQRLSQYFSLCAGLQTVQRLLHTGVQLIQATGSVMQVRCLCCSTGSERRPSNEPCQPTLPGTQSQVSPFDCVIQRPQERRGMNVQLSDQLQDQQIKTSNMSACRQLVLSVWSRNDTVVIQGYNLICNI